MKAKLVAAALLAAMAVTLTSSAAARSVAAKQRVAITAKSGIGAFVLTPRKAGEVGRDSGTGVLGLSAVATAGVPASSSTVRPRSTSGAMPALSGDAPAAYILALVVDPRSPKTVYAATLGRGVSKSTDGGRSWQALHAGLPAARVDALAIDPRATATVYAATGLGVFKSGDGGHRWRAMNVGLARALSKDRLPHRRAEGFVYALAIDPHETETVYAGSALGLYKSTNGGRSWRASGFARRYVTSVAIDPQNPQTLYASVQGTSTRGGVFKSTDEGRHWRAADGGNRGLTQRYFGVSLALDPQNPGTLYAGSGRLGVFKSTDGARSWRVVGLEKLPVGLIAIDPHFPRTIYAVTWLRGVFKSIDAGDSWQPLPALQHASAFALDNQDPQNLFAGTSSPGAVFRSTDGGTTWRRG